MGYRTCLAAQAVLLSASLGWSADEPKSAPADQSTHQALRALRERLLTAFNKNDIEGLLSNVHENVVVTWQNAEVSRGHNGVRDYYNKMMVGPARLVESVNATAEVDEPTILYGDAAGVAFGTLAEDFRLTNGMAFHLDNRWTATLVKVGDRWQVAGLHISANLFDNPVQRIVASRVAWTVGGAALAVGLLVGVVGTLLFRRRRNPA
jgi:hypothetical protein